jgi:hypothetical protein
MAESVGLQLETRKSVKLVIVSSEAEGSNYSYGLTMTGR